jgi:hypothetical protein
MATNQQLFEIIQVNEGLADSAPSWEKGEGENYDIEIKNPCELRAAKEKYVTYSITPETGNLDPTNDTLQLVVTAVNGLGESYSSDTDPDKFVWSSSVPGDVSVDDTGLATYIQGDGTAYVGAYCPDLNPHQHKTDSVLAEITYTSTTPPLNDGIAEPKETTDETTEDKPKKRRGRPRKKKD